MPEFPSPVRETPECLICPFGLTIGHGLVVPGAQLELPGSKFGTSHGFTHCGCTGVTRPFGATPTLAESAGLNASAVAVALTELDVVPQMREKKLGMLTGVTCTVTIGLTAKAGPKVEQSVLTVLPSEYITVAFVC